MKIGFPPLLISFTTSVWNPMAPIAIMIKNFDNSFKGTNISAGTPIAVAAVVITLAPIKNKIKNGNTLFNDTFSPSVPSVFFVRKKASTNVIGMIASVRVNFTVTALSSV